MNGIKKIKLLEEINIKILKRYGFTLTSSKYGYYWFKKVYTNDQNDGRIFYTVYEKDNEEFDGETFYIETSGDSRVDDTLFQLYEDGIIILEE